MGNVGFGAGYASGLSNIQTQKAALIGKQSGVFDKQSDVLKGQGSLLSGAANVITAQTKASQLERDIRGDTAVGQATVSFIKGMMTKDPQTGKVTLNPDFAPKPGATNPDMGKLTQHLYQTISDYNLSGKDTADFINNITSTVNVAPKLTQEWLATSKKIIETKAVADAKAAADRYKNAQTTEEKSKELTNVGINTGIAAGKVNLKEQSMEGVGASAASNNANFADFTVMNPKTGAVTTYRVPKGTHFTPPEGEVVIKPDTSKGMPAGDAAKIAGVEVWKGNWSKIQQITDQYFSGASLNRVKDIAQLTYAKGGFNQDLRQLYVMARGGIETQLRLLSGAAIPPEEVDMAIAMFMPQPFDNAKTIRFRFDQLNKFLNYTQHNVDPQGKYAQGHIPKEVLLDTAMQMATAKEGESKQDTDVMDFINSHK